ncbi:hypothetical protein VaNZ11_004376, partial [Volvox africanus]
TAVPRVIRTLPFNDSGSTNLFRHDYTTSYGNKMDTAPDVVYVYTPAFAQTISACTCGSNFDTVLLLGEDAALRLQDTLANDDDPACSSASRIDADLQSGITYYIVVSGFNGAAGDFVLTVQCTSCGSGAPA